MVIEISPRRAESGRPRRGRLTQRGAFGDAMNVKLTAGWFYGAAVDRPVALDPAQLPYGVAGGMA